MSIQFSNTTTKAGVIQLIERNCGFADAGISGNATLLAQFTGDVNLTVDKILGFMFPKGGTWQIDDANHTDYPTIYADLAEDQRDYSFTTDEDGNYILEIEKVMILESATATEYVDIYPRDEIAGEDIGNLTTESTTTGVPRIYGKSANGIFLDPPSSYDATKGLKVFISREATSFATTDTTKVLGLAHLYQEYLALRPSYMYAYRNSLVNAKVLQQEMLLMERDIKDYFAMREKDVRKIMKPKPILYI